MSDSNFHHPYPSITRIIQLQTCGGTHVRPHVLLYHDYTQWLIRIQTRMVRCVNDQYN